MTIGKKLYAGFGLILAILAVLFLVNTVTGYLEKSARNSASMALDSVRTVEAVRYQIMLNRLNMNNFLLSGDPCQAWGRLLRFLSPISTTGGSPNEFT